MSLEFLKQIAGIESPTYQEQKMVLFFKDWAKKSFSDVEILESNDSLIFKFPEKKGLEHLCFVGHSDVVPKHFEPRVDGDKLHGAGVSDMKGGVSCCFDFVAKNFKQLSERYNLSLILYAREEMTAIEENGLYDLIQVFPEYFKSIDLAIVAEPTNCNIQLGCVGSLHVSFEIKGKACHSARPWDGDNALYKSLPLIKYFSEVKDLAHEVCGVKFFDVKNITEFEIEKGRTSIPGFAKGNVNYRFAPVRTKEEAEKELLSELDSLQVKDVSYSILNSVSGAKVIENKLFTEVVLKLKKEGAKLEAKQAWTDVAQLAEIGVSCFNFGPGLTSQAHADDEYILISDLKKYQSLLEAAFIA